LKIPGADGRKILRTAHEERACNAVVVITGLDHAEDLQVIIPDEEERRRVKMTLDFYLDKLFPGRHLYFKKDPGISVADCIKTYKGVLTRGEILRLCEFRPGSQTQYTIELGGDEFAPRIVIKSGDKGIFPIRNPKDGNFLYWLAEMRKSEPYCVLRRMVCAIYRGKERGRDLDESKLSYYADIDINSFRRRLTAQGLDPDNILIPVRGLGWKLNPAVRLIGFGTVNVRSPGFGGRYKELDMLEDIEDPDSPHPWRDSDKDPNPDD
jgi:hypothetical protein